ncbi:hypothetical protein CKY10_02665 [Photorhabdus sp. HUG-39]|nr:hypothetical protein CKY10_02665 [Photorhabdus sp. HUG-39]
MLFFLNFNFLFILESDSFKRETYHVFDETQYIIYKRFLKEMRKYHNYSGKRVVELNRQGNETVFSE